MNYDALLRPIIRIDPREELILKLQRDMKLLKNENRFLRDQLEFPQREKPRFPLPNTAERFQKRIQNGERGINYLHWRRNPSTILQPWGHPASGVHLLR